MFDYTFTNIPFMNILELYSFTQDHKYDKIERHQPTNQLLTIKCFYFIYIAL